MSNLDALLLISGDHTEDDIPRKTSAVQVTPRLVQHDSFRILRDNPAPRHGFWATNFRQLLFSWRRTA